MTTTNKPTSAQSHHALVIGKSSLATAVAAVLANRGIKVTAVESGANLSEVLAGATAASSPISLVFNTWFANPGTDTPEKLAEYPGIILNQGLAAREHLAASHANPAIINFAFLPAMYVGTSLEDYVPTLRGGITGVTRTLARKFGNQGIRVTCVQAGLTDLEETQAWATDVVKQVQVPVKRWAKAEEVAKFMVFLGVDSLYTTGQTMIIDGGLTAGITGT